LLWNKTSSSRFTFDLKRNNPELYEVISSIPGKGMTEKLYVYLNGKPVCKTCSGPVTFVSFNKGYREHCSPKCNVVLRGEKRISTNIERYGVKNPFQNKEIQERYRVTMQKRHGVDNPSQISQVQALKKTNAEKKWGGHWMTSPIVKDKLKSTLMTRYGVENINYINWSPETLGILLDKEKMLELWSKYKSCEGVGDALSVSAHTAFMYLKSHGAPLTTRVSYPQFQLKTLIQSLYDGQIIENDRSVFGSGRSAKQLDIYIPEMNLAFEFGGLYWHAESNFDDHRYHQKKLIQCENKGIRLVTIFGDEWFKNRKICENRIRTIMGHSPRTCVARNTKIKPIDALTAKSFLEGNHIQGSVSVPFRYGAYHGSELIAVMTFSKLRKSLGMKHRDGAFELVRFACIGSIPGMASKMFSTFIKEHNPSEVISFSDRRWNTGNLYKTLGFQDLGLSEPGYWWLENYQIRHHRFAFNKAKLVKDGYDETLSEVEIMKSRGFDRIWDCGHQKFVWRL